MAPSCGGVYVIQHRPSFPLFSLNLLRFQNNNAENLGALVDTLATAILINLQSTQSSTVRASLWQPKCPRNRRRFVIVG